MLAVTEPSGQHEYPDEVKFEIRQNVKADYVRAAEYVNFSHLGLVCIQHEYGIFGGEDGGYILDFVRALRVPVVVTLHTVLKHPSPNQKAIVRKLSELCSEIVVMSRIAKDLLESSYGVGSSKVQVIPHGIPVMDDRSDQRALKAEFGVAGRSLLLTFGLLSANKGIETVIRALPEVVRRFPDIVYFVVALALVAAIAVTNPSCRFAALAVSSGFAALLARRNDARALWPPRPRRQPHSTPFSAAQASFSRFVWQQQLFQQPPAVRQPQTLCMQGNGREISLPFGPIRGSTTGMPIVATRKPAGGRPPAGVSCVANRPTAVA